MASFKRAQSYAVSIFSLATFLLAGTAFADPALTSHETGRITSAQQVKDHWERLEERLSFNELSRQSLQALNAILDADKLIELHNPKEAEVKLSFAEKELQSALQSHHDLSEAAAYIERIHKNNPGMTWLDRYNMANWAPVGGKFIARTKLSPAEDKVLAQANADLRAGKTDMAYKAVKPFQPKVQISIAIAPLEPTLKMVETALKALQNHDEARARALLNEALEHYVFIPQNDLNLNVLAVEQPTETPELIARR